MVAFEARPNGEELARLKLPGKLVRDSLAVSDSRVFVVTQERDICCLGGG